jgi:hypothetical protein
MSFLGLCYYDPANPTVVYFSIGDAIAALSIALALPQFLKPIFIFRLASRWLSLPVIYAMVFLGVLVVATGALLPSLPISRSSILGYPIAWELAGALLFLTTYGALALSVVKRARVRRGRVEAFVRSAAKLLSEADTKDYVDFASELEANISQLVQFASFREWPDERTAFYDFTFRKEIRDAQYARALLRLAADRPFCAALVSQCPWVAASMLNELSNQKTSLRSASAFVQELAYQAVTADDSIIARELEFGGFGVAPVLSNALFTNARILRECEPLDHLRFAFGDIQREAVKRLNAATEKCLATVLAHGDYWQPAWTK